MKKSAEIAFKPSEMRSTRELIHEFRSISTQLENNEVEKIVVTRSGKPVMVLLNVERAAELLS